MRATFTKILEELAQKDSNILLLTADLGRFFKSFQEKLSKQFINCGVAEENMIGIASGLALSGKKIYCYSIIPFLIIRTLESIRINICYNNLNVKLMGAGGGLVYGTEGVTHQAIEDIAIMRALPNMTIVAPGDLLEIEAIARDSVNYPGPLYIRFGRDNPPKIHQNPPNLKIGQGIVLKEGEKIALISAGTLLFEAKKAAEKLAEKGIKITLVTMPTIKPIDKELLLNITKDHQVIFTLEDHSEIGGLGSAISEALPGFTSLRKIALPDEYSKYIGKSDYLYKCYGLDSESVVEKILKEL